MGRRDRHARIAHADVDRRRRPPGGYRLRSTVSFDRVVRDALAEVSDPVAGALEGVAVHVTAVPGDESDGTALVTVDTDGERIRRVLVHRRAAEQRAGDRLDLPALVRDAREMAVAQALGFEPDV